MAQTRAEREAQRLLEQAGIDRPPVDPYEIATELGMDVIEEELEDGVSGMLYRREEGRSLVFLRGHDSVTRKRFSLAHEIGHKVLHQSPVFVDSPLRRDQVSSLAVDFKEIQANTFAANLLMPANWVLNEVERLRAQSRVRSDDELIDRLSKKFRVSREAMSYRLANLGLVGTF
jgi:Zn-dependent peptidase ImmA (M78 family)